LCGRAARRPVCSQESHAAANFRPTLQNELVRNKRHEAAFPARQSGDVYEVVFGRKKRHVPTFLSPDNDAATLLGLKENKEIGADYRLRLLQDRNRSEQRIRQAAMMVLREARPQLTPEATPPPTPQEKPRPYSAALPGRPDTRAARVATLPPYAVDGHPASLPRDGRMRPYGPSNPPPVSAGWPLNRSGPASHEVRSAF